MYPVVTTPRHLTGAAATQFEPSDPRGLGVKQRAQPPFRVAHPQFRGELSVAVESLGL